MKTLTDLDPPNRIHRLTLIFAISGWFIKNESRFLIKFTITKGVSRYCGAGMFEFISKMS